MEQKFSLKSPKNIFKFSKGSLLCHFYNFICSKFGMARCNTKLSYFCQKSVKYEKTIENFGTCKFQNSTEIAPRIIQNQKKCYAVMGFWSFFLILKFRNSSFFLNYTIFCNIFSKFFAIIESFGCLYFVSYKFWKYFRFYSFF